MPDTKRKSNPSSRRARSKGAFVEHIDKRVLWEQSGRTCALCLQPIKFKHVTIDHIVPLSKGGLHCYLNVQAAHSLCNHVKGDGDWDQERLNEAVRKRDRKRAKRYRNRTGRNRVRPLTPAYHSL